MTSSYRIPATEHRESESIKKSRFIVTAAHTPSIESAKAFIERIKAAYPDATHNCWAYVAGPPGDSSRCGMSDDGEPHGTAGQPMLNVLLHSEVGEIAVVVTRYFGGTKLGKGGLVRAYGGVVKSALKRMETKEKRSWVRYTIIAGYADQSHITHWVGKLEGNILDTVYDERICITADIPAEHKKCLDNALGALPLEITSQPLDE